MRVRAILLLVAASAAAFPAAALAVQTEVGNAVVIAKDRAIKEDLVAAGKHVAVQARVEGDLLAAGNMVSLVGPVKGSVMLAGNNVAVAGSVGNDVWLAGQNVSLSAGVADNAYLAGSTVDVTDDAAVGRDLLVAGDSVRFAGKLARDMRAAANTLVISGQIDGGVYARAESIHVLKSALIKGDLRYQSASEAVIDPGAKITGRTIRTPPSAEKAKPVFWCAFSWWFGRLVAAIVFGAVVLALFPDASRSAAQSVRRSFWMSGLIGLIVLVVVPIACVIAAITMIGIPLAVAVLLVYFVLLYAGGIFTSLAIGQWILGRKRDTLPKPLGSMILGAAIIAVVSIVPYLCMFVKLVAIIAGMGAFVSIWWLARKPATPTSP